eukprot:7338-Heterococcus_DN1.PRE.3
MQQSFKSTATTTISTVLAAAGQRCSVTTCKLNHMRSQRQQCTKCQQEPAAHCHHTPQTEQSGPIYWSVPREYSIRTARDVCFDETSVAAASLCVETERTEAKKREDERLRTKSTLERAAPPTPDT